MADVQLSSSGADFPNEMMAAIARDASRDADLVGLFLQALGLQGTPDKPMPIPARFLLHLGSALRLLIWEAQGFLFHREAGLPEAREVIRDAFRALNDPNADPSELCVLVLRLSVERFAWVGRRDLDADMALDDLVDDAALDALAEYLWSSRHTEAGTETSQP